MTSKNSSAAKLRVVIDTSVYVAAAFQTGLSEDLLLNAEREAFKLFISPAIIQELEKVLARKVMLSDPRKTLLLKQLSRIAKLVKPIELVYEPKLRDKNDLHILECAVAAKANLIITLDQDLLKLKKFRQIGIVHPKTFRWIVPEK